MGINESPMISVVMSFYNSEETLYDSIQSVIDQTYKNFEIILVDNCSTDSSSDIAKQFECEYDNVVLLKTRENSGGPAVPRNLGVIKSQGEYLAFIDSDDIWMPEKLDIQCGYVYEYDFISTMFVFNSVLNEKGPSIKFSSDRSLRYKDIVYNNPVVHSSVLVKKELFIEFMFDEDRYMIGFEDYGAYLRCINKCCRFLIVGQPLVVYNNLSSTLGSKIIGVERLSKSIYCFVRSLIAIKNYEYIVSGTILRILVYLKRKIINGL